MNSAQNDASFDAPSINQLQAGFEVAVADYRHGASLLAEAQYILERAETNLHYAQLCANEADAHLEIAVMAFNSSNPDAPEYDTLMAEFDQAGDTLIRSNDSCESASESVSVAYTRYQSEFDNHTESFSLASSLGAELFHSIDESGAANDECYHADRVLSELSDDAYRFLKELA